MLVRPFPLEPTSPSHCCFSGVLPHGFRQFPARPSRCACSVCGLFQPYGNKTADSSRKGVMVFFTRGKKRALGSLSRYISIKGRWKGIKGFTEWMCREMLREHNRKQITHRGAGSACNAPRHRNNPEKVKKICKGLEEKYHISVHGWRMGRWKGSFY